MKINAGNHAGSAGAGPMDSGAPPASGSRCGRAKVFGGPPFTGSASHGHLLLEGVPGLAKTLTVKTMAACIQPAFQRLQFTPDLLPRICDRHAHYNPRTGEFTTKLGPIFSNLILADEINRAPAKVQSALLEAMQERQITIGETTYPLSDPFLVLATQNPIEQEGTYQLPEAA